MCKVQRNFEKMYWSTMSLTAFVVSLQGVFSASLPRGIEISPEENIKNNLIAYESDSIEGLTPPVLEAKNYFSLESSKATSDFENPYVVEIHRKYLTIKTAGLPSQRIKLNQTETEGIQKLSLSFVQLLNSSKLSPQAPSETETPEWSELNPVITLTNFGISLQFFNVSDSEVDATEVTPENKRILWDFFTKYARNIFEEKLKQLKLSEKYAEVLDSHAHQTNSFPFQNFLNFLLDIMRLSIDYAETAFDSWTTSHPDTAAPEIEKKFGSTTVALFAYEEPSQFHEFPAQEFQYRKKDVDSIFYGRGVI